MPVPQLNDYVIETNPVTAAANNNQTGFVAALNDQAIEGGFDPQVGNVTWQTLISGDKTPSNSVVLGVATFPAHGVLHLHRHAPPEFYFVLNGSGTVMLNCQRINVFPRSAIFIPADAEHGVTAGPAGLTLVYGFGKDAFSEIEYKFSAA